MGACTLSSSLVLDRPAMPQVTPLQLPLAMLRLRCLQIWALRYDSISAMGREEGGGKSGRSSSSA